MQQLTLSSGCTAQGSVHGNVSRDVATTAPRKCLRLRHVWPDVLSMSSAEQLAACLSASSLTAHSAPTVKRREHAFAAGECLTLRCPPWTELLKVAVRMMMNLELCSRQMRRLAYGSK